MQVDKRFNRFSKGNEKFQSPKTDAVIYTRVSTKEQADNNASLDTQLKHCKKYAEEKGLDVVAYFGGTYESAKDDERKEFQKMLSFVKRKKSIGSVIVYSYDRFSRSGPGGAFISHELKKGGINVVSVTQSIDHNDPSGNFMEGIYHLFSEFDNQLRRDKSMTGMIEKLKQGYWPYMPPTGYTNMNQGKTADLHKIEINERGKLLKKAFEWKANDDLSLEEIARRLQARGWDIPSKRVSHFFKNPFYCGFIVSKMIPGEMIEGKHPPLVSRSTFLKVHQNLEKFWKGPLIEKEVAELPLKQFVKCDCCGTSMTGYLVKKKEIFYYKCNLKGCGNNRSQKVLHQKFEDLLQSYTYEKKLAPAIKKMFIHLLTERTEINDEGQKAMQVELASLKKKLDKLEERFVNDEINETLYQKFREKYRLNIEQIESEYASCKNQLSNLEKAVDKCMRIALDLPSMWRNSTYIRKQRIQNLLFPEGINYSRKNDDYRTLKINLLFSVIPYLTGLAEGKKNGDFNFSTEIPTWVVPLGIEPSTY
ncbi:MAG: recombinase family protein [Crocinitomicaceae bacterium]|nr:recombinase family protein [Crocinitomicaceae bacterium]